MSIGVNKRISKYLISRKMDLFWKIKVHQRFGYTMRKLISELAPSLTHNCKSYRLNISWDRPFYACIPDFPGLCTTEVYYQVITQLFNKSLNMLKAILGKNLTKYFSSYSERGDLNGPRLYIESKGDFTRIFNIFNETQVSP